MRRRGEIKQNIDAFERDWRDRGLGHPLHREMTFTQAGVVLGRGTLLAEFAKEGLAAGVVIGARAYVEDDTGKHPLNIGRSGRGLKTPSIETDTYIVILDSNNNVITCYPINPADVVYPYDEE